MKIDFMKYRLFYFFLSLVLLVTSVFSLVRYGFKFSIDFTGGSIWQFTSTLKEEDLSLFFKNEKINSPAIETQKQENNYLYFLKSIPLSLDQKNALVDKMTQADPDWKEMRFETLGPSLGAELARKAGLAVVISILLVLVFVALRFGGSIYGISAILAMLHDSLILLGAFSLFGHFWQAEIDTLFLTAILTTLSFSVHDTIVVYDRIRELSRRTKGKSLYELCNQAVAETLRRSINNSLTIIFMLLALVVLGAPSTFWFATALLVGTIAGTYSSTFTAIPLVLTFSHFKKK